MSTKKGKSTRMSAQKGKSISGTFCSVVPNTFHYLSWIDRLSPSSHPGLAIQIRQLWSRQEPGLSKSPRPKKSERGRIPAIWSAQEPRAALQMAPAAIPRRARPTPRRARHPRWRWSHLGVRRRVRPLRPRPSLRARFFFRGQKGEGPSSLLLDDPEPSRSREEPSTILSDTMHLIF
jgi:hypothetical protein